MTKRLKENTPHLSRNYFWVMRLELKFIFLKILFCHLKFSEGLPRWLSGEESPCQSRRHRRCVGLISGSGQFPGGGNSNPLQYSCLENPMDRGDWQAMVHRVTKSWILLKQQHTAMCTHTHTHTHVYTFI